MSSSQDQRHNLYQGQNHPDDNDGWKVYFVGLSFIIIVLLVFVAIAIFMSPSQNDDTEISPTPTLTVTYTSASTLEIDNGAILAEVISNGYITCGVNPLFVDLIDSSLIGDTHEYSKARGFYAEFCKALAVAIFGSYENHVRFRPITPDNRFEFIRRRYIDVVFANVTKRGDEPDNREPNVSFYPVYFTDQIGILAKKKNATAEDLQGQKICVLPGVTSGNALKHSPTLKEIDYKFQESKENLYFHELYNHFRSSSDEECFAIVSDKSQIIAMMEKEDRDKFGFVDYGSPICQEFTPAFHGDDLIWGEIIYDVVKATIDGELHSDELIKRMNEAGELMEEKDFLSQWKARDTAEERKLVFQDITEKFGGYEDILDRFHEGVDNINNKEDFFESYTNMTMQPEDQNRECIEPN